MQLSKQELEEDLKKAYKHLEALDKVPTIGMGGNLSNVPNYILAYWMLKDRIRMLENQYNQLS